MTWKFEKRGLELHGIRGVHSSMGDLLVSESGLPTPTVAVMYDYLGDVVWIRGIVSKSVQRYRRSNSRSWILVGVYTERPSLPQLALDIHAAAEKVRPQKVEKAEPLVKYVPTTRRQVATPVVEEPVIADSVPLVDATRSESSSAQEGSESEFSQMLERLGAVHERIRKAHAREEKKNMEKGETVGSESVVESSVDTPTATGVSDTPKMPVESEISAETSKVAESVGSERREVEIVVNGERINVATPILRSDSDPETFSEHSFRVILEFR